MTLVAAADTTLDQREGLVARPRLTERLVAGTHAPLAVIAAPAGYGKTTLLAEWARADDRPFAWVSLEEAHNAPALLAATVAHALDQAGTSLEGGPPVVLVLDDAHRLHSCESREWVGNVLQLVPRGSQLALASRAEPALPTGRLRAHRALVELDARDLAMQPAEAAQLLRLAGVDLAPTEVETLVARTEGWPAALYLAAVALRDDPKATAADFGGDDVAVADYLRDEVLARARPDVTRFLTEASVLDRLSGTVCDAVLRRCDSARVLGEVAGSTLLLAPLDRACRSYRMHPLLRQMLAGELRRLEPGADADLHRRASGWDARRGEAEPALQHAIAAAGGGAAAELLWAEAPAYVGHGRNAAVQRWLAAFGAGQIAGHPALGLTAATSALAGGDLDAAERWHALARQALQGSAPGEGLTAAVELVGAAVAGDGLPGCELDPADSPCPSATCLIEGVRRHLTGDADGAARLLEEGARRAAVAAPAVQALCLTQLALIASEREDWEGGAALAARAVAQVEHYGLAGYPPAALVYATAAHMRTRRGRVEDARGDLRRATRLLDGLRDYVPWYEAETRLALAWATLGGGDVAAARELVTGAERIVRRVPEAVVLQRWIAAAARQVEAVSASAAAGPLAITTAELRILRFLPTHLSFREIASRLYVSANTVKTQAHSVYRKLDASSRSQAVSRATELGLLG